MTHARVRTGYLVVGLTAAVLSSAFPFPPFVHDAVLSVRRSYHPSELALLAHLAGAQHVQARLLAPAFCELHARLDPAPIS